MSKVRPSTSLTAIVVLLTVPLPPRPARPLRPARPPRTPPRLPNPKSKKIGYQRHLYLRVYFRLKHLATFLPHCVEIAGWPLNNSHVPKQYVKGAAVHIADGDCGLANCAAATKASQAAEASQATKDPT